MSPETIRRRSRELHARLLEIEYGKDTGTTAARDVKSVAVIAEALRLLVVEALRGVHEFERESSGEIGESRLGSYPHGDHRVRDCNARGCPPPEPTEEDEYAEANGILRDLVATRPLTHPIGTALLVCAYCRGGEDGTVLRHEPECPWKRANEFLKEHRP